MAEEIDLSETPEEKKKHVPVLARENLLRQLGVSGLFSVGYGDVGSSIYYALGVTALYAMGATPLAIGIAGIFFAFTVLTYAELSAAIPEAGGVCSYTRRAFNDFMAFLAGWAILLDFIVTAAISSYSIGPYLSYFFPVLKTTAGNLAFTTAIIGGLFAINVIGIKESTRMSFGITLFDIATQLTIIVIGVLTVLNLPYLISHLKIGIHGVDWSPSPGQFIYGVTIAMVAYTGIGAIAQLSAEAKNPGKTVPRSMLITMVSVLVIYLGICLIALSTLSPHELSTTYLTDPIAGIAAHLPIGSRLLSPWVGILGATILLVASNAGIIGASRLTFFMGEHLELPRFFYILHPRWKTPYISLAIFSAVALLIIYFARRLEYLADLYNFGSMLSFTLAHLSLLVLRIKEPELPRPFKLKWNIRIYGREIPITGILGFLATFAVWIVVVITHPIGRNLGFAWMISGLILYLSYRYSARVSIMEPVEIEPVALPEFRQIKVKHILVPTLGSPVTEMLQSACKIAKEDNSMVTALYVIEVPLHMPLDTFLPNEFSQGDAALDKSKAIGREYGVVLETKLVQARSAGPAIVDTARELGCDLIVLGATDKGPLSNVLFGSSVNYVIKNAPCRVWTSTAPLGPGLYH